MARSWYGRLAPEDAGLFLEALHATSDHLYRDTKYACAGNPGDASAETPGDASAEPPADVSAETPGGPPPRPSAAEALVAMAETALATGPRSGDADRYQVVIHVDADVLEKGSSQGRCHLEDGPDLDPENVRRLSCDASVVEMLERDGSALDVGRRRRRIPPALRRALMARDHGCRWPGCDRRRFLDCHHVTHWTQGGPTCSTNLALLCRYHHRLVHHDGYTVTIAADGRVTSLVPATGSYRRHRPRLQCSATSPTFTATSACSSIPLPVWASGTATASTTPCASTSCSASTATRGSTPPQTTRLVCRAIHVVMRRRGTSHQSHEGCIRIFRNGLSVVR